MWKWMMSGLALLVAGSVRFAFHLNRTPTLEDYLTFRCGGQAAGTGSAFHIDALASAGHCWGCYAMAIGAAMIVAAAAQMVGRHMSGAALRR
jgi:hypothetical protein